WIVIAGRAAWGSGGGETRGGTFPPPMLAWARPISSSESITLIPVIVGIAHAGSSFPPGRVRLVSLLATAVLAAAGRSLLSYRDGPRATSCSPRPVRGEGSGVRGKTCE